MIGQLINAVQDTAIVGSHKHHYVIISNSLVTNDLILMFYYGKNSSEFQASSICTRITTQESEFQVNLQFI
jgi:hypothetical protein